MSLKPPLILASESQSRKNLMDQTGLAYITIPSAVDEKAIGGNTPQERAEALALAKIRVVAADNPEAWVIAGDTFVVHRNKVLEKPTFKMEAVEMLKKLSDDIHIVVTGWAVACQSLNKEFSGISETSVTFRKLSEEEIIDYANDYPVTTWSGGYNTTVSRAIHFIKKVEGSYTGLNGLPLEKIIPILKEENAI